jgi:NADH-quinone oxidoreductase subunit K
MQIISLFFYNISFILFFVSLWGLTLNRNNILTVLLSIELMLIAVIINFLHGSALFDDISGQIFSIFLLTIAAAESAIGLAILVVYYRLRGSLKILLLSILKS